MTIDGRTRQAIDIGTGGQNEMIQVSAWGKPALVLGLGQQSNHRLTNGPVLVAQTGGGIEVDQGAGADDLEMRGIGQRPFEIALPDRFERRCGISAIDFRYGSGD
jgi:hypothetical protein